MISALCYLSLIYVYVYQINVNISFPQTVVPDVAEKSALPVVVFAIVQYSVVPSGTAAVVTVKGIVTPSLTAP
jgi:hypothetical protein